MSKKAKLRFEYGGALLPVTHLFNVDGDETDDPDEAFSLVAKNTDGKWIAARCGKIYSQDIFSERN